jgi:hypothetical protein
MGRPEWRPEWGITGSAVEAEAQAMISQPQRVRCRRPERAARRRGLPPASSGHSQSHLLHPGLRAQAANGPGSA